MSSKKLQPLIRRGMTTFEMGVLGVLVLLVLVVALTTLGGGPLGALSTVAGQTPDPDRVPLYQAPFNVLDPAWPGGWLATHGENGGGAMRTPGSADHFGPPVAIVPDSRMAMYIWIFVEGGRPQVRLQQRIGNDWSDCANSPSYNDTFVGLIEPLICDTAPGAVAVRVALIDAPDMVYDSVLIDYAQ